MSKAQLLIDHELSTMTKAEKQQFLLSSPTSQVSRNTGFSSWSSGSGMLYRFRRTGSRPRSPTKPRNEEERQALKLGMPLFHSFVSADMGEDPAVPRYSPRRPAPARAQPSFETTSCVVAAFQRVASERAEARREPEPWEPGGIGVPSQKEPSKERLHMDKVWRSKDVTLSPDQCSASITGRDYGGFILSSQLMKRPPAGRWFEVSIEWTEPGRWTDGLGLGFALADSPDLRVEPDILGEVDVVQGFVSEVLPQSWMLGYDGRAKCCGRTTLLKGRQLPRGMWTPAVLEPGDTLGVLSPPDGRLMLFVNGILRYDVEGCEVPWQAGNLRAAIDLDGCTKAIHLLDSNGAPPARVAQEAKRVCSQGLAGLLAREDEEEEPEDELGRGRGRMLASFAVAAAEAPADEAGGEAPGPPPPGVIEDEPGD